MTSKKSAIIIGDIETRPAAPRAGAVGSIKIARATVSASRLLFAARVFWG